MKKENRIKKSDEILSLINLKNSYSSKNFVLYIKENHEDRHFKYALSVPKKFGDAVYRNQMKRRIRAIVRNSNISNNYDFFIIAKKDSNDLSFSDIEKEIISLLKKSNILGE